MTLNLPTASESRTTVSRFDICQLWRASLDMVVACYTGPDDGRSYETAVGAIGIVLFT